MISRWRHLPRQLLALLAVALAVAGVVLIGYAALLAVKYLSARDEAIPDDVQVVDETPIASVPAPHATIDENEIRARNAMMHELPAVHDGAASLPAATAAFPIFLPGDDTAGSADEQVVPSTNAQPPDGRLRFGSPTRILIPAIKVDSPAVEVGRTSVYRNGRLLDQWQVANNAAGFLRDSAVPGEAGNTVIAGHNNTRGEVFRDLIRVRAGDVISVFVGAREYRYLVKRKVLVREQGASDVQRRLNAQWIAPTSDERLTLVSCWPYLTNTYRLIVIAMPEQ